MAAAGESEAVVVTRHLVVPGLEAAGYQRHSLHADDRLWIEKNCYVDVIIEMLHALRLEPLAAMGFCAAIDFEGDNFTFFKPSHDELRSLYGVDIQELNVWRPILEHAKHHLAEGKFISTEADSFHLPDTSGTDYRRNHVKTTIILADIDAERRRLGYFHNAGYYELAGEDFEHLFRVGAAPDPTFLPLFAELIRIDRLVRRPRAELAHMARGSLAQHVGRRPIDNPIEKFRRRFESDLPWIQQQGLSVYHIWAFATTRQLGAASETLALHLRWLADSDDEIKGLTGAADEFIKLSTAAKTFILKAARAVNSKKTFEASATFDEMSDAWGRGMAAIAGELGVPAESAA
jgi:hypothetical protein